MEPIINAHAPEFTVQAFQDGQFKTVSSKDIEGKWALFFFYPADFTFVCPTELEDLADKYEQLKGLGVEVFSVSTDTHFVHKAWHDASDRIKKIKYTMLADPTGVLSRGFGVYKEDEGVAYRGTFLVNQRVSLRLLKSRTTASVVMLMSWYVRLRLRCSLLLTRVRFAQLSGSRAARH